jgi:Xaa-Pro dipeptidase
MSIHFEPEELARRRAAVAAEMQGRGLDGMLLFRQESMYYLTGYDTFGYVFFQCLYLGADGDMTLLTRAPDLRQAQETSIIEDVRVWVDGPDATPADHLRHILAEHGAAGLRLGIETDAYGLTGFNLRRVEDALEGFCELVEASDLVSRLRVIKSEAEIAYVRDAARLADDAFDAAVATAGPGVFEGDVLAALQGAIYSGGGDPPANEVIIGSGRRSLLFRYASGMRTIEANDRLSLEWAGVFRHYHAAMMQSLAVGSCPDEYLRAYEVVRSTLAKMMAALAPGEPIGRVDETHRSLLDAAGYGSNRYNACGYSLGTTFSPNWMDSPMLYSGNPTPAEPGMVFFVHCVVVDSAAGLALGLGRTCLVTESGRDVLSKKDLDLVRL